VLDPVTYEAKTVSNPAFVDGDADSVLAFEHDGDVHLVPEEGAEPSAPSPRRRD
jgi:nonsense-mediated mRNA decay protein 3